MNRGDLSRDGLVSYDKEIGVVSDVLDIDFPAAPTSQLMLSKAKARLFFVIPVEDPVSRLKSLNSIL